MLKKDKLAIVRRFYPNATTTIDAVNRLIDFLENELNLEPSKVMVADSICSDDVNSIQYPSRMQEFLGPFKTGGLDGFPFTGLTGMGAFASHVPDQGAVFVYYGPHIGITKGGDLGEIQRFGQSRNSGCCGAARAALAKLQAGTIAPGTVSDLDYQMNVLEQVLLRSSDRVLGASHPLQEASEVIYEAIHARITELVSKTKYGCRYVILMGAILINSDSDIGSFSAARNFDVIDLRTGVRTNHLTALGA